MLLVFPAFTSFFVAFTKYALLRIYSLILLFCNEVANLITPEIITVPKSITIMITYIL